MPKNESVTECLQWFSPERRKTIELRRGREGGIRNRHPWIFSGALGTERGAREAAVADVVDASGAVVASGFYSLHSQIRVRALTFGGALLTPDLLESRIVAAIERRRTIARDDTTANRLVHSEGDDLSGLVVDRYGDVLVVEITSAGLELVAPFVIEILRKRLEPATIVLKNDVPARKIEQLPLEDRIVGAERESVVISENGLKFEVPIRGGQKTGLFLDQRDNRALVRTIAASKRVLNLFAYSGGFGVNAAAGGARSVVEVDISEPAIESARRNHALNGSDDRCTFVAADAFMHVRQLNARGEKFDLVVCDPPAFAKSRGEVDRAARGYKDINLQALRMIEPGGHLLTFSCSGHISLDLFQKIVFAAALDAHRRVSILRRLGAGADHPVSIYCPEGEYLKGLWLSVE